LWDETGVVGDKGERILIHEDAMLDASFFPDANNITELVDLNGQTILETCESPSTQVERITWSLPALLNTSFLALHFTGEEKKTVFDQALQPGPHTELPIRAFIHQQQKVLNTYYAP